MNLKKILAAAMIGSLTAWTAPICVPADMGSPIFSQAEAAKGGARIAPRSAPAAPKSSPSSSSSGKAVSGNGSGYAPSKSANQLDKNAPAANATKSAPASGAANTANKSTGWGSALRNIGLFAGGMLLGSMLSSMLGMGGAFGDIMGVLMNIVLAAAVFIAIRWAWNRFRSRKEDNVYQSSASRSNAAPQPPITDIRPPAGTASSVRPPMDSSAGDSARSVADRYRSR